MVALVLFASYVVIWGYFLGDFCVLNNMLAYILIVCM